MLTFTIDMSLQQTERDLVQAKAYWQQLDLSYICRTMCSAHYLLPQWQPRLVKVCEQLYKRFLWLLVKYPTAPLVPTKEIDEFWHNHILHTKRYIDDCQAMAGRYIHHHPSDLEHDDLDELAKQFEMTKMLYLQEYGEPLKLFVNE